LPNVTLHLVLAERLRTEVQRGTPRPDLPHLDDLHSPDPLLRNAYLQGSFAPDLGYFPGGERRLSEVAHGRRTGELARHLLRHARTPLERAFALGWTTHVLADRMVHPLVGRGAWELRHAKPTGFLSGEADPVAHVRIETGLDAWISEMHPRLRALRFVPVFDQGSIRFLASAYEELYGFQVADALLRCHANITRRAGMALSLMSFMGAGLDEGSRKGSWMRRAVNRIGGGAASRLGRGELAMAFLSPVPPSGWLRIEVAQVVEEFPHAMFLALHDPERGFPNVNLDTGEPEELEGQSPSGQPAEGQRPSRMAMARAR